MDGRAAIARRALTVVAVVGLFAAALVAGCHPATVKPSSGGTTPPKDLGQVEVSQYKGEKLDPLSDFRENSIKGPQYVDRKTYRLKVDGLVDAPATYTYDQVVSRETTHTKVVTILCVEGWSVKVLWEGVLLSDLIDRARPRPGAVTVIFHAVDGYTTSLPLSYIRDRRIMLAYRANGVELPPARGFPFQVVAEDKYGYKWCKWVEHIELSDKADYRGYWESRGYSNDAVIGESSGGP